MTDGERKVLSLLAEAYNAFVALPSRHPSDGEEFAAGLHAIQNIVMARIARRLHPEFFN